MVRITFFPSLISQVQHDSAAATEREAKGNGTKHIHHLMDHQHDGVVQYRSSTGDYIVSITVHFVHCRVLVQLPVMPHPEIL